jgi:P4 family phage/plasmid primase-like protien
MNFDSKTDFNDFINQLQIPYIIIDVYEIKNKFNETKKIPLSGDHKDYDIRKIEEWKEKTKYTIFKDYHKNITNKYTKEMETNKHIRKTKSLYIKYIPDLFILDIDDENIDSLDKLTSIDGYEIFKNSPWKKGTTKGIHIFLKIKNIGKYKNQTDILVNKKNIKSGDLLRENNLWAYHNSKYDIFNYRNDGNYEEFEWNSIKQLFDISKMNFIGNEYNQKTQHKESIITKKTFEINNNEQKELYHKKSKEYESCIRAIKCFSKDRIDSYNYWIEAGFIFINDFNDENGFQLWLEYSQRSSKFISVESLQREWIKLKQKNEKYTAEKIHIGTLFEWAKQDDSSFYTNYQDNYYISKKSIQLKYIQTEYYNAIFDRTDVDIAKLINYLYPKYFVSDGKLLYFINENNIYIEQKIKDGKLNQYNNILNGVIDNLIQMKKKIDLIENDDNFKQRFGNSLSCLIKDLKKHCKRKTVLEEFIYLVQEEGLFDKLDETKKHLIGFDNGVYDIIKKEFRKAQRDDYISITTGYDYEEIENEEEKINECYEIFKTFFRTEDYLINFLNRVSYTFNGNKKRQEFNFWMGQGANGKSLLSLLLKVMLGKYYCTISSEYFTTFDKNPGRANEELARAKGCRVVVISEPEAGKESKLQISKLKLLSGNDVINTRYMYGHVFEYVPQFSLIFLLNDIPDVSTFDLALKRRIKIIEFPHLFRTKEYLDPLNPDIKLADDNLLDRCKDLKMAFFKLFMKYYNPDFEDHVEIKNAVNEFVESINPVGVWFKENYERTTNPENMVSVKQLMDEYYLDVNTDIKIDSRKFSKQIQMCDIQKPIHKKEGRFFIKIQKMNKNKNELKILS